MNQQDIEECIGIQIYEYRQANGENKIPETLIIRGSILADVNFSTALLDTLLLYYPGRELQYFVGVKLVIEANFQNAEMFAFPSEVRFSSSKTSAFGNRLSILKSDDPRYNLDNCKVNLGASKIENLAIKASLNSLSSFSLISDHVVIGPDFPTPVTTIDNIDLKGYFQTVNARYIKTDQISIHAFQLPQVVCNFFEFDRVESTKLSFINFNESNIKFDLCDLSEIAFEVPKPIAKLIFSNSNIATLDILCPSEGSRIGEFTIYRVSKIKKFNLHYAKNHLVYFNIKLPIEVITISETAIEKDSEFIIRNVFDVKKIFLINLMVKGELSFINVGMFDRQDGWIKKAIARYNNRNEIKTTKSQSLENGLFISGSRLSKTHFINCYFPSKLFFYASDISEIKLLNTTFPDDIEAIIGPKSISNKISALQQLKKLYEGYGDRQTAYKFQAKEMHEYYKSLKWYKWNHLLDKTTLFLNTISNFHGMNWFLPFIGAGIIGAGTFYLFIGSLGGLYIDHAKVFIIDGELYDYFFDWYIPSYLYPSRTKLSPILQCFGYEEFSKIPFPAKFWSIFNDIVVLPYFIYQFIAAFRRHGSK